VHQVGFIYKIIAGMHGQQNIKFIKIFDDIHPVVLLQININILNILQSKTIYYIEQCLCLLMTSA